MPGFKLSSRGRVVRPVTALALVAVVATVAACSIASKKGITGPPTDVSGTYSLVTIDGSPLPYAVPNNPNHAIVVQSGTVVLGSDHSYTVGGSGTSDGGSSQQVIADAGTYGLSGSVVTFTSTTHSGLTYAGTATASGGSASASTLTETVPGAFVGSTNATFALVFNKTA